MFSKNEQLRHRGELVKALRSGKYEQAQGQLRDIRVAAAASADDDWAYCCLGVACDLQAHSPDAARHNADGQWVVPGGYFSAGALYADGSFNPSRSETSETEMPEIVCDYFGIPATGNYPEFFDEALHLPDALRGEFDLARASLAEANDDGATFDQIAHIIECVWGTPTHPGVVSDD